MSREEKIAYQRECFAIYACHAMNKTVAEAAACLATTESQVRFVYGLIEKNPIDFDSPFSE